MANKFRVKYGDTILTSDLDLSSTWSKTLSCNNKLMGGDIILESYTPSRLPEGFQEVEYIASSGTQYIDTAVVYSSDEIISFNLTFIPTDIYDTEVEILAVLDSAKRFQCGWCNNATELKVDDWGCNISPSTISIGTLYTASVNNFSFSHTYSRSLYLFAQNEGSAVWKAQCQLYTCDITISDNESKSRSFVPCYCTQSVTAYQGSTQTTASAGTVGLYDLVNDRFYINSGTGTFTAGPLVDLPSGCIAEYMFNGNTNDTSGNDNNLTNAGVTFADSGLTGISKCGVFGGSQYAYILPSVLPASSSFSVSCWIKTSQSGSGDIIRGGDSLDNESFVYHMRSGKLEAGAALASGGGTVSTASTINDNTWKHVVFVNDNGAYYLYLNNSLSASTTGKSNLPAVPTEMCVGQYRHNYAREIYVGSLAAMRIYNRALTTLDIAALYNSGNGI